MKSTDVRVEANGKFELPVMILEEQGEAITECIVVAAVPRCCYASPACCGSLLRVFLWEVRAVSP